MEKPIVVYHAAAMGNWQDVVTDQLALLRDCGHTEIRLSHVGHGLDWLLDRTARAGIDATLVRSDPNTDHYETFALMEIDRLAKEEKVNAPILYLHTKGVSAPHHYCKQKWRRLMEEYVVRRWRDNLAYLADHDVVGVNWWQDGESHFSGNFWIARPDWLRRLPPFAAFHEAKQRVRYSCEMWIGAAPGCRPKSLVCAGERFWEDHYDFDRWLNRAAVESHFTGPVAPIPAAVRALYEEYVGRVSSPDMAASWQTLAKLWSVAVERKARKILDLGSGVSSVVLRSLPHAPEVWSVDDHPGWLARTFLFLADRGIRTDRLVTLDTFSRTAPADFDLVFYDLGSIEKRVEMMGWAADRVRPGGVLLLDDYNRPSVAARAAEVLSGWRVEPLPETRDGYGRFAGLAARPRTDGGKTPVIIVCRDRLTDLLELVAWLERAGETNIVFLDNDSAYPPLVRYLEATRYTVIRTGRNAGHAAPWEYAREFMDVPYVVTDPDIVPVAECPLDAIVRFRKLLDLDPTADKVGFSLKIDDLPAHYTHAETARAWESKFWADYDSELGAYRAPIDTTFALYRPGAILNPSTPGWARALRTAPPYTARHMPWYVNSAEPTAEEVFYRVRMDRDVSHWNREDCPYPPQRASPDASFATRQELSDLASVNRTVPAGL
ncbi:class I SAM-dependent methyltransferase [Fimbriiglobus ruber]|uniref:Uncharacterized protein n=1 Tax=Fimbriiglobus ruber TaxID=1908690 RepID=A0A225DH92_9BACT|nr:class I SAM-dependent methyltransferase [Fimbriiglobus ruber]OWK37291.1 hypothetical protein FRUB_06411 [Fimbriiglobus ruber]OWK39034.1 hypothetical protein FRUB_06116 [Fimbriiglobus ruber]